jgi:methylated-DNA-[protein]-cysteine S-methyltransferase
MEYYVFLTAMGWIAILGSERGLTGATLPRHSAQEALELLGETAKQATPSPDLFKDITSRLTAYFGGNKVSFTDKLDLSSATPFQRAVWQATRLIPYGETRSYGWLAEKIDKPRAFRATGQALGRNPLPIIIPCHRVVRNDGRLGGFSGGIEVKKQLLNLEASAISPQR